MFSFSNFRLASNGAKGAARRSLSGLGLFACFVAVVGTGCGGGTKYGDNDGTITDPGTTPGTVTPVLIASAPFASTVATRGTVPVILFPQAIVTTTPRQFFAVSPVLRAQLNVPTTSIISAPQLYADRQFVRWELNGNAVSNSINLSLASLPPTLSGALKAVYTDYNPGPGLAAFTPNYNQDDNPRWASLPVKVYLDPSVVPNDGVRARVIAGLDKWDKASGGIITYQLVKDDGSADIAFYTAESLDFLGEGVQGVTYSYSLPSPTAGVRGQIYHADIYYTKGIFSGQNSVDQRRFELIVAHEFGHALGIISATGQGHSPDPDDTMYAFGNDGVEQITPGDIGTIANIYRAEYDGAPSSSSSITRSRQQMPAGIVKTTTACRMIMKDLPPQYDVSDPAAK